MTFAKNKNLILLAAVAFLGITAVFLMPQKAKKAEPFIKDQPSITITPSPTTKSKSGIFTLSPQVAHVSRGSNFTVAVNLSSERQVTGADAVVTFKSRFLRFVKAEPGSLFDQYPRLKLEQDKNRVIITGIQTGPPLFSPNGEFARLTFTAVATGSATISADIQKSTIVEAETAENLLGETENATVLIK